MNPFVSDTPEKPALIIGNGPFVDKVDPKLLDNFETYGCNSVYLKFAKWGRSTDNVILTDSIRLKEAGHQYKDYKGSLYVGEQRYITHLKNTTGSSSAETLLTYVSSPKNQSTDCR